eukprot:SAG25_NODE_1_length_41698_cov_149.842015_27_plen_98_part_00
MCTSGCARPKPFPLIIGWLCTAQGVGQGTLIVKLIECNGLISGDANGLSDPCDPRLSRCPDRLTLDGSLACCTRHYWGVVPLLCVCDVRVCWARSVT